MRKYLLLSLMLLSPALSAQAPQPSSEEPLALLVQAGAAMESLDCTFVQTRTSAMMAEPLVSRGRMSYRRPDYLLWEYLSPASLSLTLDGTRITLIRDGNTIPADGSGSRMFRELGRMISRTVSGEALSDGSFDTRLQVSDGEWVVMLIPLRKDVKRMWSSLILHYDPVRRCAVRIEIEEGSDERTAVEFSQIRINGKSSNAL